MPRILAFLLVLFVAVPAVTQPSSAAIPPPVKRAMERISDDAIRAHVKFLSSDLLEGRGPGTRGDAIATHYLASQFEAMGLQPAGDNNTYFQNVSLLGLSYDASRSSVSFTGADKPAMGPLTYLEQFVGMDQTQNETGKLDSEIVFVGHGIDAPEYDWNDYRGLEVRGKTLVMLVNDPPASTTEPDLFKGRARTYYGRWTYKFEVGAAKGAQAVILIHTPAAAGYGWQVVRNSWGRERSFTKQSPNDPSLRFAGWITEPVARELLRNAGHDLDALTRAAASRDFRPVSLGYRLTGDVTTNIRTFDTANVVAKVEGSDPKLKQEAILYSAHHDHLGIGTPDSTGDRIYNGAIDNASGTAVVLELARAWAAASPKPKRSVVFAMVAAEEQGLLGSEWFARNPPVPPGRIALALNFDAIFMIGRVRDITMIGVERTTFSRTAERVTRGLGLTIVPDQDPEQGFYYRSDHFSLARTGIPAFSVDGGHEVVGKPADWGRRKADEYRQKSYHQPSDELASDWDWSSGVQMAELGFWLGWEAANAATMPNWREGEEFRAARDRSLSKAQ
jgi:Zn-dependent M28 family amino/carboxypeptidase